MKIMKKEIVPVVDSSELSLTQNDCSHFAIATAIYFSQIKGLQMGFKLC